MSRDGIDSAIASTLEGLEHQFGSFEVVEETWTVSPEAHRAARDRYESGIIGGAGAWISRDDGAVLLVRRVGDDGWADPGGKQESGENLTDTAKREVEEETGITCSIDGILQARLIRRECDDDSGIVVPSLIVIFYGECLAGTVRPQEGEIAAAKWWREHPPNLLYDDLAQFPIPFNRLAE